MTESSQAGLAGVVSEIRRRPALYLGGSSIWQLEAFLGGLLHARSVFGLTSDAAWDGIEERFRDFVAEKYGVTSSQSWAKIIFFFCEDDHEALTRFFALFDEFLGRSRPS